MKVFKLTNRPSKGVFLGVYSFPYRDEGFLKEVAEYYGRKSKGLMVKIFTRPLHDRFKNYLWGHGFNPEGHNSTLLEATKAQNLCSFEGLSPRVYEIFIIDYNGVYYPAQLTDDLGEREAGDLVKAKGVFDKVKKVLEDSHYFPPAEDVRIENVIKGKWFDFQGAKPKPSHLKYLTKFVEKEAYFVEGTHYQTQPKLGLKGFRDSEKRIQDLKLADINFYGKSVLDIGCLGGFFCNYAYERGARRIVGVDFDRVIRPARELSNHLGHFNIDYVGKDIKKDEDVKEFAGLKQFDIVLYLAVNWYLGFPKWIFDMTKEVMVVEKNGKEDEITDASVQTILKANFHRANLVGGRSDFDDQPIYHCFK